MTFILLGALVNFGGFLGFQSQYYWLYESILILLFVVKISKNLSIEINSSHFFWWVLLVFYVLICAYFSRLVSAFSTLNYFLNLSVIPFIAFILGTQFPYAKYRNQLHQIFLFVLFLSAIIWLYDGMPIDKVLWVVGDKPIYEDYSPFRASASIYGAILSVIFIYYFNQFLIAKKFSIFVVMGACLFFLYVSEHRTGWLAIAVGVFFYFLFYVKRKAGYTIFLLYVSVVLLATFIIANYYHFLDRLDFSSVASFLGSLPVSSSGRFWLWSDLITEWFSRSGWQMLFGSGLGGSQLFILDNYPSTISSIAIPHNEYIRLIFDTGVIGFAIYILFLSKLFLTEKNFFGLRIMLFANLLVEMMFSNTIFWATTYVFLILFILGTLEKGGDTF